MPHFFASGRICTGREGHAVCGIPEGKGVGGDLEVEGAGEDFAAVVLAAGKGTRMRSDTAKVLHTLCGRSIIEHVVTAVRGAGVGRIIVVVGEQAETVARLLGPGVEPVWQEEQLGTAHAVRLTEHLFAGTQARLLVLYGDMPLLTPALLAGLCATHRQRGAAATVLSAELGDPAGYGRVVRRPGGTVERIVEEVDAGPAELAISEINTGVYCFEAPALFEALRRVSPDNRQREYYLTDVIGIMLDEGHRVEAVTTEDEAAVMGVNDRKQLACAAEHMRRRILDGLMESGVTIVAPALTFVDVTVRVGRDTVIHPFCVLEGETVIGERCSIGPGVRMRDCRVGAGVSVESAVVVGSTVADGATVGPFAYVRPGTIVGEGAKVGAFVEVKNSRIGKGSKVPHQSYVGDAVIGSGVNIGAGAIFVNFDGREKHTALVEDGAFVGCNANLVAPVTVGPGAYIAAGSTITADVPPDSLAVARSRQTNKEGWAKRRREGAGKGRTVEE